MKYLKKGKLYTKLYNFFHPTETISKSKDKWNSLAKKNARYYVLTNQGENISEENFTKAGEEDYQKLIASDPILIKRMADWKERKVLEIGCGIGRITRSLCKNFGEVVGIDISEEMIRQAKERLAHEHNLKLIVGNGTHYSLPNDYFDFVFSFIVFQHMPDVATVRSNINEVYRVLNDGGIAKIQLRGVPVIKNKWFYGPAFDHTDLIKLLGGLDITILREEGMGEKYFWITFAKNVSTSTE